MSTRTSRKQTWTPSRDEALQTLDEERPGEPRAAGFRVDPHAQQLRLPGRVAEGGVGVRRSLLATGGDEEHGVRVGELVGEHLARPGVLEGRFLQIGDAVEVPLAGGADGGEGLGVGHGGTGTPGLGRFFGRVTAGGRE